ncbi:MAG: T9SS type A sorting domain-containing protein, partial [Ignavibacteria bacterium]|nr:T9SS type A sorting domain-containing protein [Ignavibacteria bacterium]
GNSIASWNGTAFSALGNGITGTSPSVNTVTMWSSILVAGGSFTAAGLTDVPVNNVAAYGSAPAAPTLVSPVDGATGVSLSPTLDWNDVSLATSYGAQVSTNPNFTSFILNTSSLTISSYTFPSQTPLVNNTTYFWRANASNGLGTSSFSLVRFFTTGPVGILNTNEIPKTFKLHLNYPNPFNPVTKIRFDLPQSNSAGNLELAIFDMNGKEIKVLLNTEYAAGIWELDFDGSELPSGAYLCRINAGSYTAVNKMILLK